MSRSSNAVLATGLSLLWCGVASAGPMRCQSVDSNVNCAGSGAASCQTVNGKTTCVSGQGDVEQSFGNTAASDAAGDKGGHDAADGSLRQRLEQSGPNGRKILIERDGTKLHVRTDSLSIDRD